jgi:hypothetical protein
VDTTYEKARRCPKCDQPGKDIGSKAGPHGSAIHTIMCMNEGRCSWSGTTYLVQVMSDGTVAEPTLSRDKSFPKLPTDREEAINANLQRLYQQTRTPGSETR